MKAKDETGNTYGILTVLERAGSNKHGKALWKCRCECGKEIIVDGTSLRTGNTTSCGCRRLSAEKTEIGKQYGELTVISVAGRTNAKKILWNCKCSCGKMVTVPTGHLHSGLIKSCGHKRASPLIIDEVGNKYGKLTVLERVLSEKSQEAHWLCQCECGNKTVVKGTNLRQGITKSCGCLASIGEYNISKILNESNISYKSQYSFSDLIYKAPLKYDFAILENEKVIRLIEFDGPQHRKGNCWYSEDLRIRDLMKNEYAKSNNIPLVRLPYSTRDKITLDLLFGDTYLVK